MGARHVPTPGRRGCSAAVTAGPRDSPGGGSGRGGAPRPLHEATARGAVSVRGSAGLGSAKEGPGADDPDCTGCRAPPGVGAAPFHACGPRGDGRIRPQALGWGGLQGRAPQVGQAPPVPPYGARFLEGL